MRSEEKRAFGQWRVYTAAKTVCSPLSLSLPLAYFAESDFVYFL